MEGMSDSTGPLDKTVVRWSTPDRTNKPLLVLLHGYGANEDDLFGLASYLPDDFAIAAVRAPLNPPWPAPGYSWYPIEGLAGRDPSRITQGASRLIEWIEGVAAGRPVGLLGFSQGGAIALQAMRLQPERFSFVVNLSGYAAHGTVPGDHELAETRPPVFWGRGSHDEVIPEEAITHTTQWLPTHSELSGRVYQGLTHSVSEEEVADVRAFLDAQLAALTTLDGGTDHSTSPGTSGA